jgi:DNA-binding TFAR19-related protein (PDSD5 family)
VVVEEDYEEYTMVDEEEEEKYEDEDEDDFMADVALNLAPQKPSSGKRKESPGPLASSPAAKKPKGSSGIKRRKKKAVTARLDEANEKDVPTRIPWGAQLMEPSLCIRNGRGDIVYDRHSLIRFALEVAMARVIVRAYDSAFDRGQPWTCEEEEYCGMNSIRAAFISFKLGNIYANPKKTKAKPKPKKEGKDAKEAPEAEDDDDKDDGVDRPRPKILAAIEKYANWMLEPDREEELREALTKDDIVMLLLGKELKVAQKLAEEQKPKSKPESDDPGDRKEEKKAVVKQQKKTKKAAAAAAAADAKERPHLSVYEEATKDDGLKAWLEAWGRVANVDVTKKEVVRVVEYFSKHLAHFFRFVAFVTSPHAVELLETLHKIHNDTRVVDGFALVANGGPHIFRDTERTYFHWYRLSCHRLMHKTFNRLLSMFVGPYMKAIGGEGPSPIRWPDIVPRSADPKLPHSRELTEEFRGLQTLESPRFTPGICTLYAEGMRRRIGREVKSHHSRRADLRSVSNTLIPELPANTYQRDSKRAAAAQAPIQMELIDVDELTQHEAPVSLHETPQKLHLTGLREQLTDAVPNEEVARAYVQYLRGNKPPLLSSIELAATNPSNFVLSERPVGVSALQKFIESFHWKNAPVPNAAVPPSRFSSGADVEFRLGVGRRLQQLAIPASIDEAKKVHERWEKTANTLTTQAAQAQRAVENDLDAPAREAQRKADAEARTRAHEIAQRYARVTSGEKLKNKVILQEALKRIEYTLLVYLHAERLATSTTLSISLADLALYADLVMRAEFGMRTRQLRIRRLLANKVVIDWSALGGAKGQLLAMHTELLTSPTVLVLAELRAMLATLPGLLDAEYERLAEQHLVDVLEGKEAKLAFSLAPLEKLAADLAERNGIVPPSPPQPVSSSSSAGKAGLLMPPPLPRPPAGKAGLHIQNLIQVRVSSLRGADSSALRKRLLDAYKAREQEFLPLLQSRAVRCLFGQKLASRVLVQQFTLDLDASYAASQADVERMVRKPFRDEVARARAKRKIDTPTTFVGGSTIPTRFLERFDVLPSAHSLLKPSFHGDNSNRILSFWPNYNHTPPQEEEEDTPKPKPKAKPKTKGAQGKAKGAKGKDKGDAKGVDAEGDTVMTSAAPKPKEKTKVRTPALLAQGRIQGIKITDKPIAAPEAHACRYLAWYQRYYAFLHDRTRTADPVASNVLDNAHRRWLQDRVAVFESIKTHEINPAMAVASEVSANRTHGDMTIAKSKPALALVSADRGDKKRVIKAVAPSSSNSAHLQRLARTIPPGLGTVSPAIVQSSDIINECLGLTNDMDNAFQALASRPPRPPPEEKADVVMEEEELSHEVMAEGKVGDWVPTHLPAAVQQADTEEDMAAFLASVPIAAPEMPSVMGEDTRMAWDSIFQAAGGGSSSGGVPAISIPDMAAAAGLLMNPDEPEDENDLGLTIEFPPELSLSGFGDLSIPSLDQHMVLQNPPPPLPAGSNSSSSSNSNAGGNLDFSSMFRTLASDPNQDPLSRASAQAALNTLGGGSGSSGSSSSRGRK